MTLATLFAELAAGADELGYEAFEVFLCRVAVDTFSEAQGYPTAQLKLCGLLQWLDQRPGQRPLGQAVNPNQDQPDNSPQPPEELDRRHGDTNQQVAQPKRLALQRAGKMLLDGG